MDRLMDRLMDRFMDRFQCCGSGSAGSLAFFIGSGIRENNALRIPDPYRVAKSKDKTPEPYQYYSYSIIIILYTILYHLSFIVYTKDIL